MGSILNAENIPVSDLTLTDALMSIGFALILSFAMYWTFKGVHRKVDYDGSFNIMLIMLSLITTVIMIIVSRNVGMSLGLVGALSLVRFRTNIRDNRDIGFVFWAMMIGLAAANRAYIMGTLASILLAALLLISSRQLSTQGKMLLVIRGRVIDIDQAEEVLKRYTTSYHLKAHNIMDDSFELVYEFRSNSDSQTNIANTISDYSGVDSINILSPSADMTA